MGGEGFGKGRGWGGGGNLLKVQYILAQRLKINLIWTEKKRELHLQVCCLTCYRDAHFSSRHRPPGKLWYTKPKAAPLTFCPSTLPSSQEDCFLSPRSCQTSGCRVFSSMKEVVCVHVRTSTRTRTCEGSVHREARGWCCCLPSSLSAVFYETCSVTAPVAIHWFCWAGLTGSPRDHPVGNTGLYHFTPFFTWGLGSSPGPHACTSDTYLSHLLQHPQSF